MVVKGTGVKTIELDFKGVSEIIVSPSNIIVKEQLARRQVEFEGTGDRYHTLNVLMPILRRYWANPCNIKTRHEGDVVEIIAGPLTMKLIRMIDYINRATGVLELTYENANTISSACVKTHWVIGECFREEKGFKKYPYGNGERKTVEIVCRDKICLIFSYSYEYRESVPRDISSERVELTVLERTW